MAYVNVAEWSPEHVADWLRGLDDEIQPYTQFFINNNINGCHLLTLCRDDLSNLNISKIGHQELVLEAVELLRQLHYNLTSETLQSLALKLGCKAQSLFNGLKHASQGYIDAGKKERVSTETLSAVSDILNLVKSLISWLDRYPFVGQDKYVEVRKAVLKLSIELASTAQRDQFAETPHEVIKESCLNLAAQSDKIVQEFNDSLIIQPASLEVAKVKRKLDDDLGIHINSAYTGIHIIEDVKFQSPAYRCGKVEEGDEIVQVNYQTVVGWQIKNIICAMREHPAEVHLTLKKRPRHPNVLGQVVTLWPYRIPSKKTAFRKLYKWNKGKSTIDIRDMCSSHSPDQRGEISNGPENSSVSISEKERQFLVGRSRSRIRRRATVTGVSPTALQPPISLEELIGGNLKKKESIGRTVSYDPSKVVTVEDSVFKQEAQNCNSQNKHSSSTTGNDKSGENNHTSNIIEKKDPSVQKSRFLQPPPDFHLGIVPVLKRQEERTGNDTISRTRLADGSTAQNETCQVTADIKIPVLCAATLATQNASSKSSVQRDSVPSHDNPKQKLVDWVQKQKRKQEALMSMNSISHGQMHNQEGMVNSGSSLPYMGRDDVTQGSQRSHNGTLQFSVRDNYSPFAETRALKRTSDSRVNERMQDAQAVKNVPAISKQYPLLKRNMQLPNRYDDASSVKSGKVKENKLNERIERNCNGRKYNTINKRSVESNNYPKFMGYSSAAHFQHQTHQSKIISLKPKAKENGFVQAHNMPLYQRPLMAYVQNGVPLRPDQQALKPQCMIQKNSLSRNFSKDCKKSEYPNYFISPSGRSLSFNNIAFSSGDSSSDECEYYDERRETSSMGRPRTFPKPQALHPSISPNFVAKVAEVYNMLNQRPSYFSLPQNAYCEAQINPASSAVIDELAKHMYHTLQMNHLQLQNSVGEKNSTYHLQNHNPQEYIPNNSHLSNIPYQRFSKSSTRNEVHGGEWPQMANYGLPPYNFNTDSYKENPENEHCYGILQNTETVCEHPVDLPPSGCVPNRPTHHMFKSATSQEIHNLYTSQGLGKSHSGTAAMHQQYCNKPHNSGVYQQTSCFDKEHTYELPWQQDNNSVLENNKLKERDHIVRMSNCSESINMYPAERESESELPCKDTSGVPNGNISKITDKLIKSCVSDDEVEGIFCPIKEDCCSSLSDNGDNCPQLCKPVLFVSDLKAVNKNIKFSANKETKTLFQSNNVASNLINDEKQEMKSNKIKDSDDVKQETTKLRNKKLQLSISTLMSNMPKPPEAEDNSTVTKSSAVQTDREISNSHSVQIAADDTCTKYESTNDSLKLSANDDSFVSSLNCTQNSAEESPKYSSSSSLSSSASGSAISSTGSCYYYVETHIRPQITMKLPSVTSNSADESSISADLRSSTLPTMGVSMLSKKRTTSSSSEPGYLSGVQQASSAILEHPIEEQALETLKSSGIITDVEHTI